MTLAFSRVPWRERPYLPLEVAAELMGCSRPQLYKLQKAGRLHFVKLAGRVLVETSGVAALIDAPEEFTASQHTAPAIAERKRLARVRAEAVAA